MWGKGAVQFTTTPKLLDLYDINGYCLLNEAVISGFAYQAINRLGRVAGDDKIPPRKSEPIFQGFA